MNSDTIVFDKKSQSPFTMKSKQYLATPGRDHLVLTRTSGVFFKLIEDDNVCASDVVAIHTKARIVGPASLKTALKL